MIRENVPTEDDWGDWKSDMDLKYAHQIFFGKSNKEVQEDFYRCVIERADELRVMPEAPFRYYMLGFRDFILAGRFQLYDSADAASCFLSLVESKLQKQPEYIMPIIDDLLETIRLVSDHQVKYEANEDVYGNFQEAYKRIQSLVNKNIG